MDLNYYLGDVGGLDVGEVGFDPYSDVGWFGSDLVKKVGNAAKSVAAAVKSAPIGIVSGQWVTNAVAKKILGDKIYNAVIPSQYRAAVDAMNKLGALRPKEVLPAMLAGATPKGINRALQVAGESGLGGALGNAGAAFASGTQGAAAFGVAKKLLQSGAPREALAAARRNLGNEAQRRAFDTAVGTAAKFADLVRKPRQAPEMAAAIRRQNIIAGTRGPRPINTLPPPQLRRPVSVVSAPVRLALQHIAQTGGSPAAIAKIYGAPVGAVARGIGSGHMPRVSWGPLSAGAQAFVLRHVSHAPLSALRARAGDTGALVENGQVYVVESGDNPSKIAKKLTGNANRYPELFKSNPNKKIATSGPFKGSFATLFAGERLIVPVSWRTAPKPGAVTTLPEVLITPGSPAVAVPVSLDNANTLTASILQAKTLLVTWSKTDGLGQAGPTDYGILPEDMSTTFGPRDVLVAMAFENWSNRTRGTKLTPDGAMNAELSDALRSWAESRSSVPVPVVTAPPFMTPPSTATPPADVSPAVPLFPPSSPPATASTPAGSPPASPFPPPSTTATPAAAKSSSDVFLALAGGAGGGMLFGPLGALIGAGLGLAVGSPSSSSAA